jgi:hypothetical protein
MAAPSSKISKTVAKRLPRSNGKAWKAGPPLLVVVDMQETYPAATDARLVARMNKGIAARIAKGWHVVFLNYHKAGDLTVTRPLGCALIWKNDDDGCHSILSYIAGCGEWPERVEFAGRARSLRVLESKGSALAWAIENSPRPCVIVLHAKDGTVDAWVPLGAKEG